METADRSADAPSTSMSPGTCPIGSSTSPPPDSTSKTILGACPELLQRNSLARKGLGRRVFESAALEDAEHSCTRGAGGRGER
jgi:hypothetical protein